jgi:hypothetical protein
MDDKRDVTDQILDLLLDALAERQSARAAVDGTKGAGAHGVGTHGVLEKSALSSPGEAPLKSAVTAATAVEASQPTTDSHETGHPPDGKTFDESNPNLDAHEIEMGNGSDTPAEFGNEPLSEPTTVYWTGSTPLESVETEDELLPEPLPMIGLGRMLGRLALILFMLLVVVNLPYNRFGTSLARAMPDEAALIIRDGLVLKGRGERIYVLENNQLRWISSLQAFEYFGYRWEQVRHVDDDFLSDFEEGRPIHLLVKCQGSPHIYALEDGRKRWIKDIPTFEEEGYVWEDVMFVSCDRLREVPIGVPIPADAGPVPQP